MRPLQDDEIILLLKAKKIRITQCRVQVLKTIYNDCGPVFSAKTFVTLDNRINRISVHRTLQLFVGKQILSKVPNVKGILEYNFHESMAKNTGQPDRKKIMA